MITVFDNWFSDYYSEIYSIFNYYPGTKIFREFRLNILTYKSELLSEITQKIFEKQILSKFDLLQAVSDFAERKRKFRKSARKPRYN